MDDNFETLVKNPILKVSCDDIPPCTPPDDKYLERVVPCDIFETQLFEEDGFEQNEKYIHGLDTSDEASLIYGDDNYWNFIENPTYDTFENIFENLIYDMSSKGSCSFETYESYKEEQSEFLYDQSELYLRIDNKDLKSSAVKNQMGYNQLKFFLIHRLHI